MRECNIIDDEEFKSAKDTPLYVIERESTPDRYDSWFVEYVINEAAEDIGQKYGISNQAARVMLLGGGYNIYTTMDVNVQGALERYFENTDNFPEEINNGLNYAMAVTDSTTGCLSGVVGRVGEKLANRILNHAVVPHTPGSTLKPIALYAPLIDDGVISWSTIFDDVPVSFSEGEEGYVEYPRNSPNVYDGLTSVKDALRLSKNTVAVRLCNIRGTDKIYESLSGDYGFDTLVKNQKNGSATYTDIAISPMALGQLTYGVPLVKMVEAYSVFSSYGVHKALRSYIQIRDEKGNIVFENKGEEKRLLKDSTAKIMNKLFENVADSGTAREITLKNIVPTAAKTGTSGGHKDKMLIGYTPFYTAGIWCGYDNGDGSVATLSPTNVKIWDDVMLDIHSYIDQESLASAKFSTEGLLLRPYCMDSGELYSENCLYDVRGSRVDYGYFTENSAPHERCSRHVLCQYDSAWKGIAGATCDPQNLVTVSLLDIPERSFPKEIYVTDAEYVWRNISGYAERPKEESLPYFYLALPEGEYVGISKSKKQFNSSCIHPE